MACVLGVVGWVCFGLAIIVGLLLNLVGLFGNWVILGAVGSAWVLTGFLHFGVWSMLGMLLLAVLGELLEMLAAGYGASRFGGGRGAAAASLAGCVAGAILATPWFPLIGTLAGAILGAFTGALVYEVLIGKKTAGASLRTGMGAALGRIGGTAAKLAVGFVMLVLAALTY